jgi:beta-fructofuranosidase
VDPDRVLVWGWAWELDRTPEQVEASGWAGVLTYPRELSLRTDDQGIQTLASRPARELTGLRSALLPSEPGSPLREQAFEVVATGPVRLTLHQGSVAAVVVEVAGTSPEPARVLVDGSLVEAFAGGRSWTTRAYPTTDSHWRVDGRAEDLVLHRLSVGGRGH